MSSLPDNQRNSITAAAAPIEMWLPKMRDYKPGDHPDPKAPRGNIVKGLRRDFDSFFQHAVPYLSYLKIKDADFDVLARQSQDAFAEIENNLKASKKIIVEATLNATAMVTDAKAEVSAGAVNKHQKILENKANEHKEQARNWLWGVLIVGAVAILILPIAVRTGWLGGYESTGEAIRTTFSTGAVLTLLYSGFILTIRNYRAHRHNEVANRHRAMALTTFRAFMDATEDQTIRGAVLLKTTEAIFGPQSSGYLSKEPDHIPISSVAELMRAAK